MKIYLSKKEVGFLQEVLKWGRLSYQEKAERYLKIEGYKENTYEPTLQLYAKMNTKLAGG